MSQLSRVNAIRRAKELQVMRPLFLDTETTGIGPADEIVEIAISDSEGKILFDTLVKPTIRIPLDVQKIHHISDEMVSEAPSWNTIWPGILDILIGKYVGIYNADFDLRMLKQTNLKYGIAWQETGKFFCVMKLYAEYFPYGGGRYQKLEDAGKQCRILIPNSHRARDDTLLAKAIFEHMARSQ